MENSLHFLRKKIKMIFYKSKDFQIGLKIEIESFPYIIIENNFVNPGKGQAFNKLKLKNILNDKIITKTIKIGEKLKSADIFYENVIFLYKLNKIFFFINIESSKYYEVEENIINESIFWIKEELSYTLTIWNEKIIFVKPPKTIELKVISTDNVEKTSVVAKNFKYAKLETGISLKVPIFIKEKDIIKIDTEKRVYISRISD